MFAVAAAPLFSQPSSDKADSGYVPVYLPNVHARSHLGTISMVLTVAIVISGLYNAHRIKIGEALKSSFRERVQWRMYVYFMKGLLLIGMSPILEWALDRYTAAMSTNGKPITAADRRQTAALARTYMVMLAAMMGCYAKIYREKAIDDQTARLEAKPVNHGGKTKNP